MNSSDHTQAQSDEAQQRAQELSLQKRRPPADVPGYKIQEFLGSGAYGEVWVGVDQNTGRQVAIKFYTHRGGVDWSLLSREVEKLVYLSADRYVVQLLVVGWDATPPYYVMEYIEHGSLDDYLQSRGALPLDEALDLFREVAVGLSHAHAKGVLHCDIKPANILLDQDAKPRLADFGQSRLSHEQSPSLGTLFYMAPEQADLNAVPDARWDVYALGAILHCALVGHPPHRTPAALKSIDSTRVLEDRLACYQRVIRNSPPPTDHRKVRGMDAPLAALIDRCLAADPEQRSPTVQAVLTDLEQRKLQRQRRPMLVLGFVGPLLLLVIMALFGWRSYQQATAGREGEIVAAAREVNYFAAKTVAAKAAEEISRYYRAVDTLARDPELLPLLEPLVGEQADPEVRALLEQLADPHRNAEPLEARSLFVNHSARGPLQSLMDAKIELKAPEAASWFVCGPDGTQLASAFSDPDAASTIGQNYGWRTYFHGGPDDLVQRQEGRPAVYGKPSAPLGSLHLSAAFISKATNRWKVAISAPVRRNGSGPVLGIVALTVDIRMFLTFEEGSQAFFALLIDGRDGGQHGVVLQHPQYERLPADERLPKSFTDHRVPVMPDREDPKHTEDPMHTDDLMLQSDPFSAESEEGRPRRWITSQARVQLPTTQVDTGLIVQVQQDYDALIAPVRRLSSSFTRLGVLSMAAVACVVAALWLIVLRVSRGPSATLIRPASASLRATPTHDMTTIEQK